MTSAAALVIDGSGQAWVANGNGSLSLFSSGGSAVSPSTGYTGGAMSTPTGIAIDNAGSVWIANGGNSSATEVIGAAAPVVTPVAAAVQATELGVKP
jgi:secreted PhoX family phosphatase